VRMKLKKEYILLALVVVALVLYLTLRSANHDEEDLPQPVKIEIAKINRLVVTDKENPPVELVKKDEKWFIEPQGYAADSVKAKNMVNAVAELDLTALVSESKNYDRYELTPKTRINIQAFGDGGTPLRAFDIGKAAPTFQHTFVVMDGDPKIYHARGQLRNTFEQNVEALRDKTIFDVDKESINALTIQKEGKRLAVTKVMPPKEEAPAATPMPSPEASKEASATATPTPTATPAEPPAPKWQAADGQELDKAEVERILGALARLQCDSYLDDAAKAKQTQGQALATLTFKNDQGEYTLSVFPKEAEKADKVPALASTTPYGFVLNEYRLKEIEKTINKLLGIEEVKK
ncbi:MAG: DUF4340 domain-containing protein, partial [Desulfatitalea sp.]|nr:DUF4340 domain-containing protein [Desulfatitalea sp.]